MKGILLLLATLWQPAAGNTVQEGGESMDALTSRVFEVAGQQSLWMVGQLEDDEFPRSVKDGALVTSADTWWCSGFFPGVLWEIYDYGRDTRFAEAAARQTGKLSGLLDKTTDHDIGFMIGCSYGNGYRLTGNRDYLPVLERAAAKLAARFSDKTGTIRSWNHNGGKRGWMYPVIIDNMMNLELLMDGWRWFGADSLKNIAVRHAETTMKNHLREDGGSFHLVDYDPEDGSVRMRITHQGYADSTTWARGEAWGLYGYVMMYIHSGKEEFLVQAEKVAGYVLARLPEDGVPYWDYSQNDMKDASAAAIMASAFVQLYEVTGVPEYREAAEREMRTLASPEYLAEPGTNGGFILKHCVGNKPGNSEVDVPLSYADYYFLEALLKYRRVTSHPRLFADDLDFEVLKKKIQSSPGSDIELLHRRIVEGVAEDDRVPMVKQFDASGRRMLGASKAITRIFSNAYLYRFTGDTASLALAERTINEVCDFDGWNPSHFLDVAGMAFAVSVGYDWLYHSLRPETLRKAERVIREFALIPPADTSIGWFYRRYHNWNQVCNSALMTAAVAFRESSDTLVRRILLKGAVTNNRCVETIYSPSGNYGEGPGYWNYGTMYQCVLNSMLDYSLGADFGLSEVTGFDRTGDYILRCYGASHKMFNYYDNSAKEYPSYPLWYFASRFRDPSVLVRERQFLREGGYGLSQMMPLIAIWAGDMELSSSLEPQGKVYSAGGVTPVIMARGDWTSTDTDWYLGFKGGQADSNHGHIDGGSFVFDAFGYRWASDPGNTNYAEAEVRLAKTGGDYWARDQKSQRWDLYPMNNDFHSVLTVDGHRFRVDGKGEILEVFDEEGHWGGSVDTTPYYDNLSSASRSVSTDGSSLTVVDEFVSPARVPVRWTLVTEAEVTLRGHYAVLTQGGKSMRLEMKGVRGCRYALRHCPEGAGKGMTFIDVNFIASAGANSITTTLKPE